MTVELRVPEERSIEMAELVAGVTAGPTAQPFNAPALNLLKELSHFLLNDKEVRQHADLVALGFALRASELESLRREFEVLCGGGRRLQPRGTVFQIAAGNVDTLFVHTWIFALLTGNRSVIRLPSKLSLQGEFLCDILNRLLVREEALRGSNFFVRYGHEREITETLSAICDVRAVWGGDATVNAVREIPLGPYGKDLAFADRYSIAAISSAAYLSAAQIEKDRLVRNFFQDALWFDQMACSSPRLVVWCGSDEANAQSSDVFFHALNGEARRREYAIEPSTRMNRFLFACKAAIDQPVARCVQRDKVVSLTISHLDSLSREQCGGGIFLEHGVPDLTAIVPYLRRQDQTLVYFGFRRSDLDTFILALNGRAIDRVVPIGQALTFGRFWDGYDLLAEFTRSVAVR